jgi:hypothetical protein
MSVDPREVKEMERNNKNNAESNWNVFYLWQIHMYY